MSSLTIQDLIHAIDVISPHLPPPSEEDEAYSSDEEGSGSGLGVRDILVDIQTAVDGVGFLPGGVVSCIARRCSVLVQRIAAGDVTAAPNTLTNIGEQLMRLGYFHSQLLSLPLMGPDAAEQSKANTITVLNAVMSADTPDLQVIAGLTGLANDVNARLQELKNLAAPAPLASATIVAVAPAIQVQAAPLPSQQPGANSQYAPER